MVEFDPPYVSTTEYFFGWDHDRMYEAAQSIDGSRILEVAEAYSDIAALVPFELGMDILKSTIHQHWEGASADRVLEFVELLDDRGIDFREDIATIAAKLHRLHACVDSIKVAVPPPERSSTAALSASRHQAVEEAREEHRQAAALALTNLYTPAYRAAGTRVPVFAAPHRAEAIPPEGGPPPAHAGPSPTTVLPRTEAEEHPEISATIASPRDTTRGDSAPPAAAPPVAAPAAASTAPARSVPPGAQPDHPPVHHVFHPANSTSSAAAPTSSAGPSAATSGYSATPLHRTPAAEAKHPASLGPPAVRSAATGSTTVEARISRHLPTVAEHSSVVVPGAVAAGAGSGSGVAVSQPGSPRSVAGPSGHLMAPGIRGMRGDGDTEHKTPSYLVNIDNGSALIGKIDPVGPSVIGG